MIVLNAFPFLFTWRAFRTDGMELVGFPFAFLECGGFSYRENWRYEMLAMDVGIALLAAYGIASVLRNGWANVYRRTQTWGRHDIYEDKNTNPDKEITTDIDSTRDRWQPVGGGRSSTRSP